MQSEQAAGKPCEHARVSLARRSGTTSGKGETRETGGTRWKPNLSTSRLSRMSRASSATVCGAGGLFHHPAEAYFFC